ncbi:MAG: hypothetical protein ACXWDI_02270, partial [Nocardioides sp.]
QRPDPERRPEGQRHGEHGARDRIRRRATVRAPDRARSVTRSVGPRAARSSTWRHRGGALGGADEVGHHRLDVPRGAVGGPARSSAPRSLRSASSRRLLDRVAEVDRPDQPRETLRRAAHLYVDFCVPDPARTQLLFLRTIPGFEPAPESYALAQQVLGRLAEALAEAGVPDPADLDLWTAVLTGLATQQTSNDPGGDRWSRLVDTAVHRVLPA